MPDPMTPASIPSPGGAPLSVGDPSQVTPGQGLAPNGVQSPNPALPPNMGGAIISNAPDGSLTRDQVQALITSWQQRVSELQSQKDKALAERDKSIALQVQMQQQLTALQEQSSAGLTSAADAAQNAMNAANQLRTENDALKGELRRYQALEDHPHLSAYRKFLPVNGSEEDVAKAIADLNTIREQEQARLAAGQQPLFPQGQQMPPGAAPVNPALNPFQALYGNRPNVNQMAMGLPGSTPAAMSPTGGGNTTQAIEKMLSDARASGDMAKYEEERDRAALLVQQSIAEQLGR